MNSAYTVYRKPCLPEDEGRRFFMGEYSTKEEADARIKRECADGYFHPGNFSIRIEVEAQNESYTV